MKKFNLNLAVLFITLAVLLSGCSILNSESDSSSQTNVEDAGTGSSNGSQLGDSTVATVAESPTRLIIPKIKVDADVEYVGLDAEGRMDVPKDDWDVAWYEPGFMPGELGSSVLAGHLDQRTGGPAVFARLGELKAGDEVMIKDKSGEEVKFVVEKTAIYQDATFPLQQVFGLKDKKRLNLITCTGDFDQNSENYDKRLVVYAVAVEDRDVD